MDRRAQYNDDRKAALDDLDALIKMAWGEDKYGVGKLKHDPAMARTLENIRDVIMDSQQIP